MVDIMILMLDIRLLMVYDRYYDIRLAKTYWLLMVYNLMLCLIKVNIVCVWVLTSKNVSLLIYDFAWFLYVFFSLNGGRWLPGPSTKSGGILITMSPYIQLKRGMSQTNLP